MFIIYDRTRVIYNKLIQSIKAQAARTSPSAQTNQRVGRQISNRSIVEATPIDQPPANAPKSRFPLYGVDLPKNCKC